MSVKTILVDNTPITQDKQLTYLASDATAGSNMLQVQSVVGMTSGSFIVCIGEIGREATEIAKILVATGGSIKLTSNLQFNHNQDTKVTIVDWDRLEVAYAPTVSGSKSTLSGYLPLQVDRNETIYNDTTQSSGFYFTRFNESFGNTYTDYSDPTPYAGYDDNMVASIKQRALKSVGESISDLITHEDLNKWLWEARREYHKALGKRTYRKKFEAPIGITRTGMFKVKLPSDVEKPHTGENIFGLRIGSEREMTYQDKKEWDLNYRGVARSTLAVASPAGDSSIQLSSNRDFTDSGNVRIEGDNNAYTVRNVDTGKITLTGTLATAQAKGTDVWQNSTEGLPQNFTVVMETDGSNYIYFSRPLDTAYARQNIYSDYFTTMPTMDSDADILDEPDPMPDAYVNYLAFKIKKLKNKGLIEQKDDDYLEWMKKKQEALGVEYVGQTIRLVPDISNLD